MKLKSYFAGTVEAALNAARQELGPEAMLVDSRRTAAESRQLGEYEVICALIPAQTQAAPPGPAASDSVPNSNFPNPFRAASLDKLSNEVSELKRYMERMALTISKSSAGMANLRSKPELAAAFAKLSAAEVEAALAHDIIAKIAEFSTDASDIEALLAAELEGLLSVDARLGRPNATRRIAALVGPPGAGKTTCLVKLAARYGLTARKPAQILTLDTYRVAAAEQLRSYAAILGIGFQVVETTAALAQALEEHRQKDLILIDTPGFGANEMDDARDIARFLATHPEIDCHLVLPSSLKPGDMKRIAGAYEIFRPAKLLFSRIDETNTFGPILNLVAQTGKPVSFLSSGQQVPDDFAPARVSALVDLIVKRECLEEALNAAVAAA